MQCPLTGGRDRVRERGKREGWERKMGERERDERGREGWERERCRGISLKCWQHDQLLLVGKTTLNVIKLSDVRPSYQHGCCSCWTPQSSELINSNRSHQSRCDQSWKRNLLLIMRTWSHLRTCNLITWHDPIVGALWRFDFIWVHLTWWSSTLLKQEFLTLCPPSLLMSLNMGRMVSRSTLTQIHGFIICQSLWLYEAQTGIIPVQEHAHMGTSLDGVTTILKANCFIMAGLGWEKQNLNVAPVNSYFHLLGTSEVLISFLGMMM